jgi:tRNA dimethylallyltransferase
VLLIDPERAWLYDRCDPPLPGDAGRRAWEQLADARAAGLSADDPVCRGLGARALIAALAGEIDRDAAVARAQRETRNYAKRQLTWFRHQLAADVVVRPPDDPLESRDFHQRLAAKAAALLGLPHKT